MEIQQFIFNPFQENTYVIYNENECFIIDPGCYSAKEEKELKDFIELKKLKVRFIVNTHLHIDHILGNTFVEMTYHIKSVANMEDEFLIKNIEGQAHRFGITLRHPAPSIGKDVKEGDQLILGNELFEVYHVPGHSPGSIVLYNEKSHCAFTGDVLFKHSIGRTDLEKGNYELLIKGIQEKLLILPDNTIIYCGHGPSTTIGEEKAHNPFL
jgi:glyoxylase-like metal-dependent hydrolase (beta-lactamase superfamily II)